MSPHLFHHNAPYRADVNRRIRGLKNYVEKGKASESQTGSINRSDIATQDSRVPIVLARVIGTALDSREQRPRVIAEDFRAAWQQHLGGQCTADSIVEMKVQHSRVIGLAWLSPTTSINLINADLQPTQVQSCLLCEGGFRKICFWMSNQIPPDPPLQGGRHPTNYISAVIRSINNL